MTSTWTITKRAPTEALRPFIMEYSFRKAKVPAGHIQIQGMPVWCQSTIDFFLGEHIETIDYASGQKIPFSRCVIRGLRTFRKNYLLVQGDFTVFVVHLTPTGLYGLLGTPAHLFSDEVIDGTLVYNVFFAEITEQLMSCADIDGCVAVIEPYLLRLAQKTVGKVHTSGAVNQMVLLINTGMVPAPISCLQAKICLSQRQLERNFIKEIGTSPKHYSRMKRFINMLCYKTEHADTTWSALAYEFGYTDQMHLIRDFQHFLGINPGKLFSENFAGFEEIPPKFFQRRNF